MGVLFAVLTGGATPWHSTASIRAFGAITSVSSRAEMIRHAAEAFFLHFEEVDNAEVHRCAIEDILRAYMGWKDRRNDVAHGMVTEQRGPDYSREEQPLITTYSLCPSHGASRRWLLTSWEPTYNFISEEIDRFADGFAALDKKLSSYTTTLEKWRREREGAR
jgi:hypothetical protein